MNKITTEAQKQARINPLIRSGILQRKCAGQSHVVSSRGCDQRITHNDQSESDAPPIVHDVLRSAGQPLDSTTRTFMEPKFGRDFSQVRVHTDKVAAESALAVNALAYTVGSHIVFGAGYYVPTSPIGRHLLMHELAHIVQQSRWHISPQSKLRISSPDHPSEQEAHRVADQKTTAPIGFLNQTPLLQRSCGTDGWQYEYDGCSLPPGLIYVISSSQKDNPALGRDTHFSLADNTGPCDRHDRCYQTCYNSPEDQAHCDREMYDNMMAVCMSSTEPQEVKGRCAHYAGVYYMGLRAFGGTAFSERQSQVCPCAPLIWQNPETIVIPDDTLRTERGRRLLSRQPPGSQQRDIGRPGLSWRHPQTLATPNDTLMTERGRRLQSRQPPGSQQQDIGAQRRVREDIF